jgi:hypothetical protein
MLTRWPILVALAVALVGGVAVLDGAPSSLAAGPRDMLAIPFMSQLDGSLYAGSDCGPASVAMVIAYQTGERLTPLQVRKEIIKLPGGGYAADPGSGTAIRDLGRIARAHGVEVYFGDGPSSVGWGTQRIRAHLAEGQPVIVLTRLAYLPGYAATAEVDHYIVLTGTTPGGFTYHDPALRNGAERTITEAQLARAQRAATVPGQGAAFEGQPRAAEPEVPTLEVSVVAGDTLSGIAARYGIDLNAIVKLNPGGLRSVDHIEVGQRLLVPAPAVEAPRAVGGGLSVPI